MRLLVCGARDYGTKEEERKKVWAAIEFFVRECKVEYTVSKKGVVTVYTEYKNLVLIQGAARGVDTAAQTWAVLNNVAQLRFPADWQKYGRAAGPIRNKQMLDQGKPDKVLAFLRKDSKGTANMIAQAKKAGVHVITMHI